jgi:hypothetical protein
MLPLNISVLFALFSYLDCSFIEKSPPYCDNDLCKKSEKYCCGYNECCFTWTFWYLWIAFGFGVIVGVFFMWKCCSRVDHSKESHQNVKHWSNAEKQQTLKKKDLTVAYLPLGNFNQKFVENKIDDQNIHVR